jgi:hypothetical protein
MLSTHNLNSCTFTDSSTKNSKTRPAYVLLIKKKEANYFYVETAGGTVPYL